MAAGRCWIASTITSRFNKRTCRVGWILAHDQTAADSGLACRAPSCGITLTAFTRGSRSARPYVLVRSPPMHGGARARCTVLHNRKREELCGHITAPRCAHKSADRVLFLLTRLFTSPVCDAWARCAMSCALGECRAYQGCLPFLVAPQHPQALRRHCEIIKVVLFRHSFLREGALWFRGAVSSNPVRLIRIDTCPVCCMK